MILFCLFWLWPTNLFAQPVSIMKEVSKRTSTSETLNQTADPMFIYTTTLPLNVTNNLLNETMEQSLNDQTVIEPNITALHSSTGTTENLMVENATLFVDDDNDTVINLENMSSNGSDLSAAGITGISLACIFLVCTVSATTFFLYKNWGFNRPQVLGDHCSNLDSSGYIDDTSIRDNSEEMYSLDNDSFLNSLEAMTIQNYWTDNVKHTKL